LFKIENPNFKVQPIMSRLLKETPFSMFKFMSKAFYKPKSHRSFSNNVKNNFVELDIFGNSSFLFNNSKRLWFKLPYLRRYELK